MTAARRFLFAASGTGGHVFPGLAVARAASENARIRFVGASRGMESRLVPPEGFDLTLVEVPPLRGGSPATLLRTMPRLVAGLLKMFRLIRNFRPHAIFGTGGAVSGVAVLAGRLAGVPSLVLEPNAEPGLATRWSARFTTEIAIAWEDSRKHFPRSATFVSGIPVRAEFLDVPDPPGKDDEVGVLVTGGSQGAARLNRLVLEALPLLAEAPVRLRITHQTGPADEDRVRSAYAERGVPVRVAPFLDDMAAELAAADLVVGRAGAITCAELAAAGRPAILVPAPVAGAHQHGNAATLESAGAALSLAESASGASFARALLGLASDGERRRRMGAAARGLARPSPARTLVRRLDALAAA